MDPLLLGTVNCCQCNAIAHNNNVLATRCLPAGGPHQEDALVKRKCGAELQMIQSGACVDVRVELLGGMSKASASGHTTYHLHLKEGVE